MKKFYPSEKDYEELEDHIISDVAKWLSTVPLVPSLYPIPCPMVDDSINIPNCCKRCSNHPSNGGSGLCHCVAPLLGQTYTTTSGKIVIYSE